MASLDNNALTTVQRIQDELGITGSSDSIKRYINRASDRFERQTGRKFFRTGSVKEKIKIDPGEKRIEVTEHLPLRSINSISIDGDTVSGSNYEIEDGEKGYIRHTSGSFDNTGVGNRGVERYHKYSEFNATVDYEGGYATPNQTGSYTRDLPHDIEEAIIDYSVSRYRSQGKNPNIKSEEVLESSVEYVGEGGVTREPVSFTEAVKNYKLLKFYYG